MSELNNKMLTFEVSAPEDFAGDYFYVAVNELEYVRIIPKARELRLYFPRFAVTIVFAAETTRAVMDQLLRQILHAPDPVTIGVENAAVIGVAVAVA